MRNEECSSPCGATTPSATFNVQRLRTIEREQRGAFYLLDTRQFIENFTELLTAFRNYYPRTYIAYSYKTNYTPRLCQVADQLGGYAEVVSDMEYEITRRLGIDTSRVHFNGPYKQADAVREIILGGGTVNLDDYAEVADLLALAEAHPKQTIRIGLRCNFPVGDGTTSRFGFDVEKPEFGALVKELQARKNVEISGLQCHFACRCLDTWKPRAEGIAELAEACGGRLEHIDLGGGLYGKMKDELKAQFDTAIPSYEDYAREAAQCIAEHFGDKPVRPALFIEPGSALVGDVMKFVAPVVSIKDIRGKAIATLLGSVYNINPTLNGKNPPITVYSDRPEEQKAYKDLDFGGYTCIEGDYLYRGYNGPLAVGDLVVFDNVGSYSVVLKPPFILPNFPILEWNGEETRVVKRKETFDDLFKTYVF